jgi:hypothetical protein
LLTAYVRDHRAACVAGTCADFNDWQVQKSFTSRSDILYRVVMSARRQSRQQMTIMRLSADRTEEAVGVGARAFVANPLHVVVFGRDAVSANEAFFRIGLSAMPRRCELGSTAIGPK